MGDLAKRVAGPTQLSTSAATAYTVPASTTTILRNIHVQNGTGTAATFTLSIGTDAAATRFWDALSIPANSALDWSGFLVLATTEIVQWKAGTATALVATISGVEVS